MNPTINRLKLVFLGLFALGAAGIWAYQILYVIPAQKCDRQGGWWDRESRLCAAPIYIPSLTGRPAGVSRKDWSEQQAARQAQRDREGYPTGDEAAPKTAPAPAKGPAAKATVPAK